MFPAARWFAALADLLLPPVCLGCDGAIHTADEARLVCRRCRARLRAIPVPACERCGATRLVTGRSHDEACPECAAWPRELTLARSACLLLPPANRLVHQLKYHGWRALARPLAERMAQLALPDWARAARMCVPVPTTAQRLRERGYNQAQLLAAAFAAVTGREPVHALIRTGSSGSQTALRPLERKRNVARTFQSDARAAARIRDADVLLIDDVLTTGATASACALALSAAGARRVALVTFARALDARRLTQLYGAGDDGF